MVASFDFPESRVVAEIYAQALDAAGIAVRRELDLGPRELVLPALQQGHVDLVPEYVGSALDALDPGAGSVGASVDQAVAALRAAVEPDRLRVLTPSAAANRNVVVVAATTAAELGLRATSDLGAHAPALVLAGPPECPVRPRCLPGLEEVYGLRFAGFLPLAGSRLVATALADGVVDVGVLFATDAALADGDLVALADDRGLQPADHLAPLVRADVLVAHPRAEAVLDEVSAELDTAGLAFLNWRLAQQGSAPAAEARAWLVRRGLIHR